MGNVYTHLAVFQNRFILSNVEHHINETSTRTVLAKFIVYILLENRRQFKTKAQEPTSVTLGLQLNKGLGYE